MDAAVRELLNSPQLPRHVEALTRALEMERAQRECFYEVVTEQQKAEFINGEIVVHSPVKVRHNATTKCLLKLLDLFVQIEELGFVGYEKLLTVFTRNHYEPDVCFFGKEKAAAITPDQTKLPAPDFIAEVLSPSTEKIDRGIKFEEYAAHGVGKYFILDPEAEVFEQYVLDEERYGLRMKSGTGEIASTGFTIPGRSIFDAAINLQTLSQILP